MIIKDKPLREHYEDCNGQLAVFNYIDDLEKHINYLSKLNIKKMDDAYDKGFKDGVESNTNKYGI